MKLFKLLFILILLNLDETLKLRVELIDIFPAEVIFFGPRLYLLIGHDLGLLHRHLPFTLLGRLGLRPLLGRSRQLGVARPSHVRLFLEAKLRRQVGLSDEGQALGCGIFPPTRNDLRPDHRGAVLPQSGGSRPRTLLTQ